MAVPGARRWWALAAIVVSALTIGFDATILNVALPTLATKIGASNGGLQWIVDSYILIFAGLLLPAGILADRYGRKRAMLTGLALFAVASVVAMTANGPTALIVARGVMGIGAAIIMPVALALVPSIFEPAERPRAVGLITVGLGLGMPLGPLVGGYLLGHFWWGSVFAVNVPTAAVAIVAVALLVPESRDPAPGRLDLTGTALATAGLVSLVYGIVAGPDRGWSDPVVLATLVAGAALLAAFVLWQRRAAEPIIDLGLFADRQFLWAALAATTSSFALFGLLFVLPQYLQVVAGNDAFGTGSRLIPMMLGLVVGARIAENVAARAGARVAIAAGLAVAAAGLGASALTSVHTGYGTVAAWLAVIGAGVGLSMAPAMTAILDTLPAGRTGMGSSLSQTLRQVGGALGVAVLGSVLASAYGSGLRLPATLPAAAARTARESVAAAQAVAGQLRAPGVYEAARVAYVHAMDNVLLICALTVLAGALGVVRFLPRAVGRQPAGIADLPPAAAGARESSHEPARTA